jgi:hypothetical protein
MASWEAEERGGGSVARRDAWKDGRGVRGPAAVRMSDAALSEQGSVGPVMHGPRPAVGARGRGEVRGLMGQPGEKEDWAEPR